MKEKDISLKCENISKIYPGVRALNNINLILYKKEVHGIVGRNGSGKSTLVNIIYGKDTPTKGKLYLNNRRINLGSPIDGLKEGIALVPQEPVAFESLTIAENLALPNYGNAKFVNWKKITDDSKWILEKFKIKAKPNDLMSDLSIGHQQLILVGKIFYLINPDVVLLDEVTSSINLRDKELFYSIIEEKKAEGKSIVFITHSIKEIYEICDRVTVIQNGEIVKTESVKEITSERVVQLLFGKNFEINKVESGIKQKCENKIVLSVNNLTRIGEFENINFNLRYHEIVGLIGLRGAGKSELLRTIAGFKKPFSGGIKYFNKEYKIKTPIYAIRKGIVYLPENREEEGLIGGLSVGINITISALENFASKFLLLNLRKERNAISNVIKKLNIKTPSINQEVKFLSGGNKQKVLIGRFYIKRPLLYLLDEPARGLDIETKQEVLKIIKQELAQEGTIIITSPDLEDLVGICDRLIVLYEGKVIDILEKPFGDIVSIYHLMQGLKNRHN